MSWKLVPQPRTCSSKAFRDFLAAAAVPSDDVMSYWVATAYTTAAAADYDDEDLFLCRCSTSIYGSAVCVYNLTAIDSVFNGPAF